VSTSYSHHTLLDCVRSPVVLLDDSLCVRFVNAAAATEMAHLTIRPGAMSLIELVHPADRAHVQRSVRALCDRTAETVVVSARLGTDDFAPRYQLAASNHLRTDGIDALVVSWSSVPVITSSSDALSDALSLQLELSESLAQREELLAQTVAIHNAVQSRQTLDEVFALIAQATKSVLGVDVVAVRVVDPIDNDRLVIAASIGLDDQALIAQRNTPAADNLGGRAYQLAAPLIVNEYQRSSTLAPQFKELGLQAAVAVPIDIGGVVSGSITACSLVARTFDHDDVEVLEALALHAGMALRDAHSVEAMSKALTDVLTNLPNRRLFIDRLGESLAKAQRRGHTSAVVFVDLDGFKSINDGRGHGAGDHVLVEVARRLVACLSSADLAARWGGDEFVLLIEGADQAAAVASAQRIATALAAPISYGGAELQVGATIGIYITSGEESDPELLVRRADIAMYHGKTNGRGRIEVFVPALEEAVVQRSQLEAELLQALRDGAIEAAYQPLIAVRTGQVVGVEVLARWTSPTRGFVPPDVFVAVAESLGRIGDLDRAVLAAACRDLSDMRVTGTQDLVGIEVNLSALQLSDELFADRILDIAAHHGVMPQRLTVELTESAMVHHLDVATVQLAALRQRGIKVALDDFGTGYSSLAHLQHLPIDFLKIDRSFVAELASERGRRLVATIIELSASLDVEVVAEGVETKEQLDTLGVLGVDYLQGYYLARPMPIDALGEFLTDFERQWIDRNG
jgi:diguanylate cyclase (GGDEF)-like protein